MAGGLSGRAASVDVTGLVLQLNGAGPGIMASAHGEVTARAQRRQRARSAPCGSRRGWSARSGEWKATRRAPVVWAALGGVVGAVSPAGVRKAAAGLGHGRRTFCCSSPTPARRQAFVRCRGQGGGDRKHGDAEALARSTTDTEETTVVQTLLTELD